MSFPVSQVSIPVSAVTSGCRKSSSGRLSLARRSIRLALVLVGLFMSGIGITSTLWQPEDYTLLQAKAAESGGEFAQAVELYKRFLTDNPGSTLKTLVMNRISVLHEATRYGAHEALIYIWRRWMREKPDNLTLHCQR